MITCIIKSLIDIVLYLACLLGKDVLSTSNHSRTSSLFDFALAIKLNSYLAVYFSRVSVCIHPYLAETECAISPVSVPPHE